MQLAKPLLEKFPNGVFKKLIFEELEKKVGTPIGYTPMPAKHPKLINAPSNKGTPVRLAIAALLHQPSLALEIDSIEFLRENPIAGVSLLSKIIYIWKQQPELSHAALIERFRGQPEEQQIQKLISWDPPEMTDPQTALQDALVWIQRKTHSSRVQELIDKQSTDGLNEDERQEFKNLLHQKAS